MHSIGAPVVHATVDAPRGPLHFAIWSLPTSTTLLRICTTSDQTKTRNVGVNRMLDRYVPVAATRCIGQPDGTASADEFHLRYVFRGNIPNFFAIAAGLPRHRGGGER